MQKIQSILNLVSSVLIYTSSGVLLLLMLFITYDVVARYIFKTPLAWSVEVSSLMLIVIIFLGLGYATSQRKHIRITFLVEKLPVRGQRRLKLVVDLLGLAVLGVITWLLYCTAYRAYEIQEGISQAYLTLREWWPDAVMALGATLFFLQLLIQVYKEIEDIRHA